MCTYRTVLVIVAFLAFFCVICDGLLVRWWFGSEVLPWLVVGDGDDSDAQYAVYPRVIVQLVVN